MGKDAYWFPHDSNARHDPRMTRLRMKHGLAGIGFYWCCIEFLRDQDGYEATLDDFDALSFEVGQESGILDELVDIELLSSCGNGKLCSESLKNRMFEWDERKRKLSEAGKRGGRPVKARGKGGLKVVKARSKPTESNKRTLHKSTGDNITREERGHGDDAYRVAEYLLSQIRSHRGDYKKPNLEVWAKDIDLAIRVDNRQPRELCEVAKWAHTNAEDTFWRPNLLSGKKLREKFDTIKIKMNNKPTQPEKRTGPPEKYDNPFLEGLRKKGYFDDKG